MNDDEVSPEVSADNAEHLISELWSRMPAAYRPNCVSRFTEEFLIVGTDPRTHEDWHIEVESMAQARRDLSSKIAEIKREREGKRGRR